MPRRSLMLELCCKVLRSFGSNVRTMQDAVPGLGHSWLSRYVIALATATKVDYAQSQLSSMQQGKNESAHDYSLRFEAVAG